jgi:TfoX/Sxy family transcriptional regulator of competence genes
MSWKPSSEGMIASFDRLLPVDPRVERRTMFGCPMGFANGNLFLGLHENRFLIRLGDADRAVLIKEFRAKAFEPMPGRKSGATLIVPERIAADPATLRSWCGKALSHALSLPPKKAKKKKAAAKSSAGRKTPKRRLKSAARKKRTSS